MMFAGESPSRIPILTASGISSDCSDELYVLLPSQIVQRGDHPARQCLHVELLTSCEAELVQVAGTSVKCT